MWSSSSKSRSSGIFQAGDFSVNYDADEVQAEEEAAAAALAVKAAEDPARQAAAQAHNSAGSSSGSRLVDWLWEDVRARVAQGKQDDDEGWFREGDWIEYGDADVAAEEAARLDSSSSVAVSTPLPPPAPDLKGLSISNYAEAKAATSAESEPLGPGEVTESVYGRPPPSPAAAAALVPVPPASLGPLTTDLRAGLVIHAQMVSDDFADPAIVAADGSIKPRRPMPVVRAADFFRSLTRTDDNRWIFSGVLNGWPALTEFQLVSITGLSVGLLGNKSIVRFWDAGASSGSEPPGFPSGGTIKSVRITLRAPRWSGVGYSADSPGAVWWFHAQRTVADDTTHAAVAAPVVRFGTGIISALHDDLSASNAPVPRATHAHLVHHRYAMGKKPETAKDKMVYHALIVLEWDHGRHCSVVELATLNGVGGRLGKVNWFRDKLEARTQLYRCLPACMIAPWIGSLAEIRCHDVPARNIDEFLAYMREFEGPQLRFLDPRVLASHSVRLSWNSQADIMKLLLNYITRDRVYNEISRSCQTFAADLFGFLCAKKDTLPTTAVSRVGYQPRPHMFLYEPDMFDVFHA